MAAGPERATERKIIRRPYLGRERVNIWTPIPMGEMMAKIAGYGSDIQPFFQADTEDFQVPDRRIWGIENVYSDTEIIGFDQEGRNRVVLWKERPSYMAYGGRILTLARVSSTGQAIPAETRFILLQTVESRDKVAELIAGERKRLEDIRKGINLRQNGGSPGLRSA